MNERLLNHNLYARPAKSLTFALIAAAVAVAAVVSAAAAGSRDKYASIEITGAHAFGYASPAPRHFIYKSNESGNLFNVVAEETYVAVTEYDNSGKELSSDRIRFELPIFGTFYRGEEYVYAAFGQENPNENDSLEVLRIVKFNDKFERMGAVSLYGRDITAIEPFRAGTIRLAESGGLLAANMSRLLYKTDDGLNHQTNFTFTVDTVAMRVIEDPAERMAGAYLAQPTHVSHSFDQYVLFDGDKIVYLDHGDASPRSVYMQLTDREPDLWFGEDNRVISRGVEMYGIEGLYGANYTGVSIGDFRLSDTHYLAIFNSVDFDAFDNWIGSSPHGSDFAPENASDLDAARGVMIASYPRNGGAVGDGEYSDCEYSDGEYSEGEYYNGVRVSTVADYWGEDEGASIPELYPNGDGSFTAVWDVFAIKNVPSGQYKVYSQEREFSRTLARGVEADGRPSGRAKEYANRIEFYKDYLDVEFFPEAPEIAGQSAGAADGDTTVEPPYRDPSDDRIAEPSESVVLVDQESVRFEAYTVGNNNYFKLRDIAEALIGTAAGFGVEYDADLDAIVITSGERYISVGGELAQNAAETEAPSSGDAEAADAEAVGAGADAPAASSRPPAGVLAAKTYENVYLDAGSTEFDSYNIGGYNYFMLRDLAAALNFNVSWNESQNTISIETGKIYEPPAITPFTKLSEAEIFHMGYIEQLIDMAESSVGEEFDAAAEWTVSNITDPLFMMICRKYADDNQSFDYKTNDGGTWTIARNTVEEEGYEILTARFLSGYPDGRGVSVSAELTADGFTAAYYNSYDYVGGEYRSDDSKTASFVIEPYFGPQKV